MLDFTLKVSLLICKQINYFCVIVTGIKLILGWFALFSSGFVGLGCLVKVI